MTFRTRLALLFAAVVSVLLVASGFGLVWLSRASTLDMVDRELMARARNFERGGPLGPRDGQGPRGPRLNPPGQRPPLPPLGELAPRFIPPPGTDAVNPPEPLDPQALAVQGQGQWLTTVVVNGSRVRVLTQPMPDGARLQVGYDLRDVERLARAQAGLLLLFLPVAVVVAGLLGWFLADRAVKPIERVTRAAAGLGAENLSTRIPVEGDDEIATLARQFNQMVGRLEVSFQQRDSLTRQLQASLDTQKAFVADASHELRTPLARMKLLSSSALHQKADAPELREALVKVDAGADDMTRLVTQLLTLARTDVGDGGRSHAASLTDVVDRALALADAVPGPPVDCEPVPAVIVRGREEDLARALANLVENARRYAPESPTVRVGFCRAEGMVSLSVSDQGPGVESRHLPHLTDRFYRVDSSRTRTSGGTGLGLAIVKAMVEAAGGSFRLASDPGKGFTATMELPLCEESPTKQLPNDGSI